MTGLALKWTRAKDGALFGVCKGVARATDLPVGMVRLAWILCVLLGGVGIGVYILLAISLPREDNTAQASKPRLLGVCANFSKRTQLEVGIVRFLCLAVFLCSLGLGAVLYLAGYLFMDQVSEASRSKPSSPPSVT